MRGLQDPATVAWNLATGLYYKTQPEPPWKLAHVRPGVCYIGLVFKMIPNDPQEHACCAAQMFLNEGDAVVFRGANGPWKTGDYEFHLKPKEAQSLIAKVLETFKSKHGAPPKEFFIHGRTTFNEEEWKAFKKAAPKGTNVVGVRIKETHGESKLFRDGDYPVMRGTAIILDDRNACCGQMASCRGWTPISALKHQTRCRSPFCAARESAPHSHRACRHHGPYQDQLQRLQLQRRTARHDSLCEQSGRRVDDGFGPGCGKAAAQVLRLKSSMGC